MLLATAPGTFQTLLTTIPTASGEVPAFIVAGDFNNDGVTDFATESAGTTARGSIFSGNGTGIFAATALPASSPTTPSGLVDADFNGDGKLDLAFSNAFGSGLHVLVNSTANLGFAFTDNVIPYTVSGGTSSLAVANFATGLPGLFVSNNGGGVYALTNTTTAGSGTVTFTNSPVGVTNQSTSSANLAAGDFNADGITDVIADDGNANPSTLNTFNYIATATATATVSPAGPANGNDSITAAYSGDTNYAASVSAGTSVPTSPISDSLTIYSNPASPITNGTLTRFRSIFTVNAPSQGRTATGSVQFYMAPGQASSCSSSYIPYGSAVPVTAFGTGGNTYTAATDATTNLPHGTTYYCSIYTDDSSNNYFANASSPTTTLVVNDTPTVTVSLSQTPILLGQSVNLTASVVDGSTPVPNGSVAFTDGGFAISGCGNEAVTNGASAACNYTPTTPGGHGIRANYTAVANNTYTNASSDRMILSVQAPATVAVTSVTVRQGSPAPIHITVSGNYRSPTGTVTYTVNGGTAQAISCTAGSALICDGTFDTSSLTTAGSPYAIVATYSGDMTYASSANGSTTTNGTLTVVPDSYSAGSVAVGSSSSTQTATLVFPTAYTLDADAGAIVLQTQGTGQADFTLSGGTAPAGACTAGTRYYVGQSCTVSFVFSPQAPGLRSGSIKLFSAGTASPVAIAYITGTGTAPLAGFANRGYTPVTGNLTGTTGGQVATDAAGNIYVLDFGGNRLLKETPNGSSGYTETILAISGLTTPRGLALDGAGNLFVADQGSNSVVEAQLNRDGTYTSTPVVTTGLSTPVSIAVDGAGNLYVANGISGGTFVIEKYNGTGYAPTTISGTYVKPTSVTVGFNNNVYLADATSAQQSTIYHTNSTGSTVSQFGTAVPIAAIAADASGNVYFTEAGGTNADQLSYSGMLVPGAGPSDVRMPSGVALDQFGNEIIVESGRSRVVFSSFRSTNTNQFAPAAVGSTSPVTSSDLLENIGNTTLQFSAIEDNSSEIVTNNIATPVCTTSSVLDSGNICYVGYVFRPQTAGPKTGTATYTDNSLNDPSSTQTTQLSGTATKAVPTVTITILDASGNTVNNGSVVQGATVTLRGTLTGAGNGAATPTGALRFNFNGTNPPATCTTTNGVQTCTATVSTAGLAPGTYSAYSRYDGDANYTASPTTGPAMTTITVVASSSSPVAPTPVGSSSANGTSTIVFTMAGTATAPTVTTLGSTVKDYQLVSTTCPTGAVTVGQSCTVTYSFTPTQVGPRPGAVAVYDSNGTILGIQYLNSVGQGAVVDYQTTTPTFPYTGITTPQDIAFDGDSTAYITASGTTPGLTRITSGSSPVTTAITVPAGAGAFYGVAVDGAGRVFATANGGLYVVPKGSTTAVAYAPAGAPTLTAPRGIAIDVAGNIFVANSGAATPSIVEYPANGGTPFTYATGVTGYGLAVDAGGNLYVVDTTTNTVQKFAPPASAGGASTATPVQSATTFTALRGVAVDLTGNVFVSANGSTSVYEIPVNSTGTTAAIATGAARSANMLHITPTGKLYVAEGVNNDIALLDRTVSSLPAFPATMVGSTSALQAATIENNGNTQLTLSNFTVTFGGQPSSDFTVNNAGSSCTNGAAPGALCRFRLAFTPQSNGLKTAIVTFTGSVNPTTLNVTGNAIQTTATVAVTNPANVVSGSTIPVTATITGSGVRPAGSITFQVDGGAAQASTCSNGTNANQQSCTANLPTVGLSQGNHTIVATFSGDANYVSATGNGTFNITSASYATPNTAVASTSPAQTATLTFTSSSQAAAIRVLTQGNTTGAYQIASGGTCATGNSYVQGDTCTVQYTFNPATPGIMSGAITVTNTSGIPVATAFLSGLGTGPETSFTTAAPAVTTPVTGVAGYGIVGDSLGNLFIAENSTGNIYKETPNGSGGYSQSAVQFVQGAYGLTIDGAGNLYVTSTSNTSSIYKLVYTVPTTNIAPSYNPQLITTDVQTGHVAGIASDANGNLYAVDSNLNRILKFTVAGTGYNESVIATATNGVTFQGIAVDAAGNLYVTGGNQVYKETFSQGSYTQTLLSAAPGANLLSAPNAAGELYVPGTGGLLKLTPTAGSTTTYTAVTITGITGAQGTFIDRSGNVYTSTGSNGNLVMLDVSDAPALGFATTTVGSTSLDSPKSIVIENIGNTALTITNSNVTPATSDFTYDPSSTCSATANTTVNPAASCSATINFRPLKDGALLEAFRVASNSLNDTTTNQRSLLSGNGVSATSTTAPDISVAQNGTATFSATVTGTTGPVGPAGGTFTFTGSVTNADNTTSQVTITSSACSGVPPPPAQRPRLLPSATRSQGPTTSPPPTMVTPTTTPHRLLYST